MISVEKAGCVSVRPKGISRQGRKTPPAEGCTGGVSLKAGNQGVAAQGLWLFRLVDHPRADRLLALCFRLPQVNKA
jgi:hypothetical protein